MKNKLLTFCLGLLMATAFGQRGFIVTVYSGPVYKYSLAPINRWKLFLKDIKTYDKWASYLAPYGVETDRQRRKLLLKWFKNQPSNSTVYTKTVDIYRKQTGKLERSYNSIIGPGNNIYEAMSESLVKGSINTTEESSNEFENRYTYSSVYKAADDSLIFSEIAINHDQLMKKSWELVAEKTKQQALKQAEKPATYSDDWLTISETLREDLIKLEIADEMKALNEEFKKAEIAFNAVYEQYITDLRRRGTINAQLEIASMVLTMASYANNSTKAEAKKTEIKNLKQEKVNLDKKLAEAKPVIKQKYQEVKKVETQQFNTIKKIIKNPRYKKFPEPIYNLDGGQELAAPELM
jgi:hypothetical protein